MATLYRLQKVNLVLGKTTSNLDKSARIQRSWPVRTQSQDRNILRKSCLFEEKIKNSNQSHHHHRLRPPFTRYKFGGSQDGESGPMSDPRSWSRYVHSPNDALFIIQDHVAIDA